MTGDEKLTFTCEDCEFYRMCEADRTELEARRKKLSEMSAQIAAYGTLRHWSKAKQRLEREREQLQSTSYELLNSLVSTQGCAGPLSTEVPEPNPHVQHYILRCGTDPTQVTHVQITT